MRFVHCNPALNITLYVIIDRLLLLTLSQSPEEELLFCFSLPIALAASIAVVEWQLSVTIPTIFP